MLGQEAQNAVFDVSREIVRDSFSCRVVTVEMDSGANTGPAFFVVLRRDLEVECRACGFLLLLRLRSIPVPINVIILLEVTVACQLDFGSASVFVCCSMNDGSCDRGRDCESVLNWRLCHCQNLREGASEICEHEKLRCNRCWCGFCALCVKSNGRALLERGDRTAPPC